MSEPELRPDEPFPEPSAALSMLGALVDVWLDEMPEKQRRRVLERISQHVDWQARSAHVVRLRAARNDASVARCHGEAASWWRRMRAVWFDRPR